MNVIIFDVDGVLLEADSPELDTFVEAFMECEETKVTNTDWSSYVSRTDIGGHRGDTPSCLGLRTHYSFSRQSSPGHLHNPSTERLRRCRVRADVVPEADRITRRLAEAPRAKLALATGNLKRAAHLRLQNAGLWHYFEVGAFCGTWEQPNRHPWGRSEDLRI